MSFMQAGFSITLFGLYIMSFITRCKKIAIAAAIALIANQAIAAAPPADTIIGNQAVATYQNSVGDTITVQSNLVETIINQVAGIDIEADQTKDGAPGGFVFFPHVMENTGNGDDSFGLTAVDAAGDSFDFTSIVIYPDADRDGVPDVLTPLATTPILAAGETYGIVIRAQVPVGAVATNTGIVTVTSTSVTDGTVNDVNTDTVSVTTGGIIELTKSMSPANVSVGDTVSVTLSYNNTGLSDATNVLLQDVLPTTDLNGNAITLTYTATSGGWSDTAVPANIDDAIDGVDDTNGQGDTIDYSYDGTDTIAATISRIPAGRSGNVTFQFVVTAANAGVLQNIGTSSINGGPTRNSNPANVTVDETYNVTIADRQAASYLVDPDTAVNLTGAIDSATDDDAADNDIVTEDDDVNEGAQVPFEFVVTNHANLVDTFNITVTNNSTAGIAFPAGTTFALVHTDGVTPLVDSNGDSIADTGPIALNSAEAMRLIATLPAGSVIAAPANYSATITATSIAGGNTNSSTAIITGAVLSNPVDLENIAALGGAVTGATGVGAVDNAGAAWTTQTVNPGATATFFHRITNNGASSNSFNLEYSTSNFAAGTLPAGWIVQFFYTGIQVSNTGLIAAGGSVDIEARVIVPADATPALTPGQSIYFRAISPITGVSDTKLDAVIVNEIVDISIQSNSAVQAAPGGIVDIPHTITNNGNSTITDGLISITDPFTGMAATLFYDTNNNGVLDGGDPVIDNINDIAGGLAPGATARIFVRVQVPAVVVPGVVEQGTITVASALTSASGAVVDANTANNAVVDTITIVSGDLTLLKEQALDAACDGVADGGFTQSQQAADPGNCIMYRITATNTGTADATTVTINDQVPSFTTLETSCATSCVLAISGNGTVNTTGGSAADELAGSTIANVGTLSPGGVAVMTFTVQIDN